MEAPQSDHHHEPVPVSKFSIPSEVQAVTGTMRFLFMSIFFVDLMLPLMAYRFGIGSTGDTQSSNSGLVVGLVMSSGTLGVALTSLGIGKYTDNRNVIPRLLFVASSMKCLANVVIYLAVVVADSLSLLIVGNFLIGATGGAIMIPVKTIIADAIPLQHRAEALGNFRYNVGIGVAIGTTISLTILNTADSWEGAGDAVGLIGFLVFAAGCAVGAPKLYYASRTLIETSAATGHHDSLIVSGAILPISEHNIPVPDPDHTAHKSVSDTTPENESSADAIAAVREGWPVLVFMFAITLEAVASSFAKPFIPVLLQQRTHSSEGDVSLAYTPGGILSLVLMPRLGQMADSLRVRDILVVASVLGSVSTYALVYVDAVYQGALLLCLDFSAMALVSMLLEKLISSLSTTHRSSLQGKMSFALSGGRIVGPVIGGLLWDKWGRSVPFTTSAVLEFALGVFYFILFTWKSIDMLSIDL